ncbi:hypothetical protein CHS0354_003314 [Potamilus streckersoni]|uniref:Uncharacterized protein n=1 Tax=Potamilus streckersoni TaxID=2493646 RepID=A0AAE0VQN3_9BIVA|nr:hypothetical protein CHS0354_003314 [Potamilus streckersoni]
MAALACVSVLVLLFIMMIQSAFVRDPCDEMTAGVPAGQVYKVKPSCTQGSVSWSYPRGTLRLFFAPTNMKSNKFAVCFRSYVNMSSFDVLDVAKGDKQPCKRISDKEVCTGYYNNGILTDVVAKGPLRFLSEVRYRTESGNRDPQGPKSE